VQRSRSRPKPALAAVARATTIIRREAGDVFLPDWPVVRAEAVREDVLDEELARSVVPA
jgi:hypothetical protein